MDKDQTRKPLPLSYGIVPRDKRRIAVLIAFLLMLAMVLAWGYRERNRSQRYQAIREPANMVRCQQNLKSIGQAILEYAAEHEGKRPESLSELLVAKNLDSRLFVCPCGRETAAAGATTREVVQVLNKLGHLSYLYAPGGFQTPIDPNAVLLYEAIANHGVGINLIYGDGRNDFMPTDGALKLITELQSGHNPPRPEMLK